VAPAEVEAAVAEHPGGGRVPCGIGAAPVLGEEIGLLVVPSPDARLDAGEVRRHCAERLAETRRPGVIRLVEGPACLATASPAGALPAGCSRRGSR